jgi:hypothetical protein
MFDAGLHAAGQRGQLLHYAVGGGGDNSRIFKDRSSSAVFILFKDRARQALCTPGADGSPA